MGNRCVIVSENTNKDNANRKLGIYLHWYGSKETVEDFLNKAKEKGIRTFSDDNQYCWARLCQIISNELTAEDGSYETGIGIGIVSQLDTDNGDNGVYYVNDEFEIVKHTNGKEFE